MPYPFTECADCKEEKTGRQCRSARCRSCAMSLKMLGKTLLPATIEKIRVRALGNTNGAGCKGKIESLVTRQKKSLARGGDGDILNRKHPGLGHWTRLVKERDCHKCAECGYQGTKGKRDVDAHHVIPKAAHPELATVLFNGVTLCKPCHKEIHAA